MHRLAGIVAFSAASCRLFAVDANAPCRFSVRVRACPDAPPACETRQRRRAMRAAPTPRAPVRARVLGRRTGQVDSGWWRFPRALLYRRVSAGAGLAMMAAMGQALMRGLELFHDFD